MFVLTYKVQKCWTITLNIFYCFNRIKLIEMVKLLKIK